MAPKTFDDSALQPQPQPRPLINNISRNSARHYQSPSTISLPPIYNRNSTNSTTARFNLNNSNNNNNHNNNNYYYNYNYNY
ncbi:hypothetical protein RhiirC2_757115, partial [Rhizophagus irregularis]